jgi:Glyoxalase superfamily protein
MRDFRDAKAMAQTLRDALKAKSVSVTHSESLELVAKILGFHDWNVLSAQIQSGRQPPAYVDRFGTPYTEAMHVAEHYGLLDYDAAKAAMERAAKEWISLPAFAADPGDRGKGLHLEFMVEDTGVFTMAWTATVTYRRLPYKKWHERICSENAAGDAFMIQYYSGKDAKIPTADTPDF